MTSLDSLLRAVAGLPAQLGVDRLDQRLRGAREVLRGELRLEVAVAAVDCEHELRRRHATEHHAAEGARPMPRSEKLADEVAKASAWLLVSYSCARAAARATLGGEPPRLMEGAPNRNNIHVRMQSARCVRAHRIVEYWNISGCHSWNRRVSSAQ